MSDFITALKEERARLQARIEAIDVLLNNSDSVPESSGKRKRNISPEGLRRLREGQAKRWEKVRAEKAAQQGSEQAQIDRHGRKKR
jgi:hypothetical protein